MISSNIKPHLSDSYPLQDVRRCMLLTLHLPVETAQDTVLTILYGSACCTLWTQVPALQQSSHVYSC